MARKPTLNDGAAPIDQPLSICVSSITAHDPNQTIVRDSFVVNPCLQLPDTDDGTRTMTASDASPAVIPKSTVDREVSVDTSSSTRSITSRLPAYTDFNLFYSELAKAKQSGQIDEQTLQQLSKEAE
jgi:hypothetical protein